MQTPMKNLVHVNDYSTFLIRNTEVWNNLKSKFTEDLGKIKHTESFNWFGLIKNKTTNSEVLHLEIIRKLSLRLELIQNEYNRLQYYVAYKHEQVELHPELATAFFDYTMQEIKSGITFH